MAVSALPQAPYRQDRKVFPTPLIGDVVFSEIRDCNRTEFPAFGTPHPNTAKWPDHKLVFIKGVDIERNEIFEFFYAADRADQDKYNWRFSKADIGGTKFDSVVRTYVTPRDSFVPTAIAMGSAMPDIPAALFSGVYVLAEQRQTESKEEVLNSLYVFEEHVYVKKTVFSKIDYDEAFGLPLRTTQTLFYRGEVIPAAPTTVGLPTATAIEALFLDGESTYWGLQSTGVQRSGDQLTTNWFVVTEQQVVPKSIVDTGRTYPTTQDYAWPPVLNYPLFKIRIYTANDGSERTYFEPNWLRNAYSGPCAATVKQQFYVTPPAVTVPDQLLPMPIDVSNPFFALRVPPTLHPEETLSYSPGTADPVWEYEPVEYHFEATNEEDWPPEIIASDTLSPTRGGYMRTTVTISRPTIPVIVPP